MTEKEFYSIKWQDKFIVEYIDGNQELLHVGNGLIYSSPNDDPNGRGGIAALLPKKHPRNKERYRQCFFDEIKSLRDESGDLLWSSMA